jgi:hypothetical protein
MGVKEKAEDKPTNFALLNMRLPKEDTVARS